MPTVALDLSRQRFYSKNFKGVDLRGAKMRNSLFNGCDFDDADMAGADCEGSEFFGSTFRGTNCYRTNFKDAKLAGTVFEPKDAFGMTVTLLCKTFDKMEVSQMHWYSFLMFATSMIPAKHPVTGPLVDDLIAMIGAERYVKLRALFGKREL